jgi:hypothetical protein
LALSTIYLPYFFFFRLGPVWSVGFLLYDISLRLPSG